MFRKIAIFIICCSTFYGCVTLNSNQSGRTLGKGKSNFSWDFTGGNMEKPLYTDKKENYVTNFGYSRGLTENFDIGLALNSGNSLTIKTKYQFLGNKESIFASSIGFDASIDFLGTITANGIAHYGFSSAIYNSIHITDYLAIIAVPKYILFVSHEFPGEVHNNIYGYSTGIMLGKNHHFVLEISQFVNNKRYSFKTAPHFSFGIIYNF